MEPLTPVAIDIMSYLLEQVGEGNSFTIDGDTYTIPVGAAADLRQKVNDQLYKAVYGGD